jgi:SAM-dependent methyltransferase
MGTLEGDAGRLGCGTCGERYDGLMGRPMLIARDARAPLESFLASEDGQRMLAEYRDAAAHIGPPPPKGWTRFLRPPAIMHKYDADVLTGPAAPLFAPRGGQEPLVLNVGGGPTRVTAGEVTLNIGPFPNVDLVGDGHRIPVADGTFDSVISLAVLEHVADPYRVAAEMIRVLKPGGLLYSEVPFIFFFHGYPTDYHRFTREGMKRLFSGLADTRIGLTHGPVSAVLQSGNMVAQLLVPARLPRVRKLVNGAYRLVFFPFKYLDLLLRDHPEAHVAAGGFYVLGRKPAAHGAD